jgi:hypothetical protein
VSTQGSPIFMPVALVEQTLDQGLLTNIVSPWYIVTSVKHLNICARAQAAICCSTWGCSRAKKSRRRGVWGEAKPVHSLLRDQESVA